MTKRRVLTLTDPRAIRVLAHEVRQQLLDELSGGQVLTATEAAGRCGITPSAMSYHLRAMERWGFVERVESTDGRERPWRMAVDSITIDDKSQGVTSAVANSLLGGVVKRISRALHELVERDDPLEHAKVIVVGGLYLTDEEADELDKTVDDLLDRFGDRHDQRSAPPGTTPHDIYWLNLPSA